MHSWLLQIIRFGIVGLTSNVVLYLFYLAMSQSGIDPKLAMTFSFVLGLTWTFTINKRWSFSHQGDWGRSSAKFFSLYGALYFINLTMLLVLVDVFGLSHVLVQAGVFLVYVPIIFLAQRYWIFRDATTKPL